MFIKILSRKTPIYKQLLQYILKEKDIQKPIQDAITHNFKTNTIEGITHEFMQNEAFRNISRSDQIMIYHEILSLSANETVTITDDILTDLTKKYIELRGHEGMFVSSFHKEKDHTHIHLATSPLKFKTGNAFRVSKARLQEIKLELQQYHKEKYPELTESFCNHGIAKEYVTDRKYYAKTKHERARLKEEVQQTVITQFTQSKSMDEFLTKLQEYGLHYYERKGIATGIVIDETKIRFTRLGIEKESLELLQNNIQTKETQQKIITNMKNTEINFPMNTEDLNYNIKPDEFENFLDFEKENEKETELDLDKWIEDNLPKPEQEIVHHSISTEEIVRRNKKDLDIENEIERE
ncbi:MAG: relaxase/mobilization nuclease domain-containing protein [Bacteroidia bacterium]